MRRREFIWLLGGAVAAWPVATRAQEDGPVARVGVLGPSLDRPGMRVAYPFFLADLRKLGFVEGRNLLVEFRPVEESVPGAFAAANELVAWKADVLFAFGTLRRKRRPRRVHLFRSSWERPISIPSRKDLCKVSRVRAVTSPASSSAGRSWW